MGTSTSLKELREEDLDAVSAGHNPHLGNPHLGNPHLGNPHLGNPHLGNPYFGNNVVQINIAVLIALALGGSSVIQLVDQSNFI
jgi:hypothetical protein